MSIFDKILNNFGYFKPDKTIDNKSDDYIESLKAYDTENYIDEIAANFGQALSTSEKTYKTVCDNYSGWVYTCVDRISKTLASIPLELYAYKQDGKWLNGFNIKSLIRHMDKNEQADYLKAYSIEKILIRDHPFIELLKKPNELSTRFSFWVDIVTRLELHGSCGLYKVFNNLGTISKLYVLPLDENGNLEIIPGTDELVKAYKYTSGRNEKIFEKEYITFIKYPNPSSIYKGKSPFVAQSYPYDIDTYLLQQQNALLKNKTMFGTVLSTDQTLTKPQVSAMKTHINSQKGAINSGKFAFFHSGVKPVGNLIQSAKDYMFKDISEFARDRLITGFNLSLEKVGINNNSTQGNMLHVDRSFYQECIKPKAMLIEEVFESEILPVYDDRLTCDFLLPDIMDQEVILKEREIDLKYGRLSINEDRAKDGLPPVPWGDNPWFPSGYIQYGTEVFEQQNQNQKRSQDKTKSINLTLDENKGLNDSKDEQWKSFIARNEKFESAFLDLMKNHFIAQRDKVISFVMRTVKDEIEYDKKANDTGLNDDDEIENLQNGFKNIYQKIMMENGKTILDELIKVGLNAEIGNLNYNPESITKWIEKNSLAKAKYIEETTKEDLVKILANGYDRGDSAYTISNEISGLFDMYNKYRAPLIARTEVAASANASEVITIQESGLQDYVKKYWIDSKDEATRETHKNAGNVYDRNHAIPIDQDFYIGSDNMQSPGNGIIAKENINCRCTLGYVVDNQKIIEG